MKRVLIGPSQFKVSNPGYDATNATAAQLCFDAFGSGAFNGIYLSGRVSMAPGSGVTTGTVAFGKTFATPPQVWCKPLAVDGKSVLRDWDNQKSGSSDYTTYSAIPSTTQLVVTVHYAGSTFTPFINFAYVIFQT